MSQTCLDVNKSLRGRHWTMRCDDAVVDDFVRTANLPRIDAAIIAGRGIDAEHVDVFLSPTLRQTLPDPSCLKDADIAAQRILDGISRGENIWIFSDYDVDGGTSAAQLIRWGRAIGYEFKLYIPDRVKEGYGPSKAAFEALKADGADLVITLDCGAAAHNALGAAHEMKLPVIVVDHHLMSDAPPPAFAIINPNRLDDTSGLEHLAAAGVTFMLVIALQRLAKAQSMMPKIDLKTLLGLTALGTICDVVPLKGVNRTFVRQGLKVLSNTRHIGIRALADIAKAETPFTAYHCGFVLGPRINAGGRIGRADMGAQLLATDDAEVAYTHAAELDRVNFERRAMQASMLDEALDKAEQQRGQPVIVVSMEGWHPGIIGIVAGRLKDRFETPAIVIGINEDGEAKGSGRSIQGVNLGAAISAAKEAGLLDSGGGHAMAGGLTMDAKSIPAFTDFINTYLSDDVSQARANQSTRVDVVLSPSAVKMELLETIERIGPFGAGHPQPCFAFADMRLTYAQRLKGNHIRVSFEDKGGQVLSGICFGADEKGLSDYLLAPNRGCYHIIGQLKPNHWKGRTKIDFHLQDMAPAMDT
ncbi:MAG: single-stranded-DNA-specific exonuclease RecJ [Litorimonas sp.]